MLRSYLNQAMPNQKWLGTLQKQELRRDCYREKAETEQGNHWLATA